MSEFDVRVSYIEQGKSHRLVFPEVDIELDVILEKLRTRFPERHFYCWSSSADGACSCADKSEDEDCLTAADLRRPANPTPVAEVMSAPVITAHLDDEVTGLLALMAERGFQHFPVVGEAGRLVGVISDRDILRRLSPFVGRDTERESDAETLRLKAHQVMVRRVATVSPTAPVGAASSMMKEMKLHCLPVVDDDELVGIVTATDLMISPAGSGGEDAHRQS